MDLLNFDTNGFLTPYTNIEADLETLEKYFTFNDHRKAIFQNYLDYLADFQNEICKDFVQWIDGSFISKKDFPNDIDIVTFLDYSIYLDKQKIIGQFKGDDLKKSQKIDAYIVKIYPLEHPQYNFGEFDTLEWWHLYYKTRPNRHTKKVFRKGFLELKM